MNCLGQAESASCVWSTSIARIDVTDISRGCGGFLIDPMVRAADAGLAGIGRYGSVPDV